ITRFPTRIKATATALKLQRYFGKYQISYSKKVFSIVRIGNVNHFQIEVGNPNTKYFIFDTGKKHIGTWITPIIHGTSTVIIRFHLETSS
ncbi:hypothetical protein OAR29_03810, partial [Rhodospirillales bacterium]|nr:hypothetical protein [Rhodospirillales bacterium]